MPILVVQHMPPIFTAVFAEHLKNQTGRMAREPFDGERLLPGTVYVAPGGRHMGVTRVNGHPAVRLHDSPPVNFCRPSVDVLFQRRGRRLRRLGARRRPHRHGIGRHARAPRALVRCRRHRVAQDEATSIVWGMPGSVARAGLASAVLPLEDIGGAIDGPHAGALRMTDTDFAFLRTFLLERSGLSLSAEKRYLVDSRLLPLCRRREIASIAALVERLKSQRDADARDAPSSRR